MTNLEVTSAPHAEVVVNGELDASTVEQLTEAIGGAGDSLRIDLSGCTFIDSSALSALLAAHKERSTGDASFVVVSPSRPVMRLFEICNVVDTFTIEGEPVEE